MTKVLTSIKEKITKFIDGTKVLKWIKDYFNKGDRLFVLSLYLIAVGIFIYTLVQNYFVIPITGDFKLQEIPFYYNGYDDWWNSIKNGEFVMWDDSAFLGVNNIGANTFYYLWNIFFLPVLLVPRALVPQAQAFMIMTKFVLAGYVMKKLLSYLEVSDRSAKLAATAYAFSGWGLYYLWFNHFLEVAVLFPLVIYGVEKVLREKRVALLVIALFLSAITNYFFFIMTCFCSVIYAMYRYFKNWKEYTGKERAIVIGLGIASYVVALLMSLLILVPAFTVVLQSSRTSVADGSFTSNLLNALKAIKDCLGAKDFKGVWESFKTLMVVCFKYDGSYPTKFYMYPVVSYFFPPYSCYDSTLFNNNYYDNMNCSIFLYTPMILMLIPSLIQSVKEKKISHIIGFIGSLLLLFTPFAYYCFSGFTSVCYGRWQLFITTITCIYIAKNFDKIKEMKRWYFCVGAAISVAIQVLCIIYALKFQGSANSGTYDLDESKYLAMAECGYTILLFVYFMFRMKHRNFTLNLRLLLMIEAIVMGNVLVQGQGTVIYENLYGGYKDSQVETKFVQELMEKDKSYFRILNSSADRDGSNVGMVEGYRGVGTFHSIYNYELQDFIDWSRMSYTGSWSMGVHEKRANLDTFLNIKYYMMDASDNNIPFGYKEILRDNATNTVVYENENYVPFGLSFDTVISTYNVSSTDYMTSTQTYESSSSYQARVVKNENLYVRYAILDAETAEEVTSNHTDLNYIYNLDTDEFKTDDDVFVGDKEMHVVRFSSSRTKVKKAIWDQAVKGEMDGYEDEVDYSRENATHLLWNSEINVDCSDPTDNTKTLVAPQAKERGGAFITVKARMGENLIIYLYDKDGNELVHDKHMKHGYGKSYDRKYERGFYVNDAVYSIKVVVKDTLGTSNYLVRPDVTYQYYDTYKANIEKLKEHPIENVKVHNNSFDFSTNYENERFVVTTIPFDAGWSLKDKAGNNYTVYKAQGGFVGFVAKQGTVNYTLSYETPGLNLGALGFALGTALFGALYIGIDLTYIEKEKIKKQLDF